MAAVAVLSALGPAGPVKRPRPHRCLPHPDPGPGPGPGPSPPPTRGGEGPAAVPLDGPEGVHPPPPPPLPPHRAVPEAGLPLCPLAGEVTGGGGTALTVQMTITKGRECYRRSVQ